jgi:hypothetical protein
MVAVYAAPLWHSWLFSFLPPALLLAVFVSWMLSDKRGVRRLYYITLCTVLIANVFYLSVGEWSFFVIPERPDQGVLDPADLGLVMYLGTIARTVTMLLIVSAPLWKWSVSRIRRRRNQVILAVTIALLVMTVALLLMASEHIAEVRQDMLHMSNAAHVINMHYWRHHVLPVDPSQLGVLPDWDVVYYAPVNNADREGLIVAVQRQSRTSQRHYIRLGDMLVHTFRHDELEDLLKADDKRRRAAGEPQLWHDIIRASQDR